MSVVVLKVGGASTGGIAEAVAELRDTGYSVCVVHGAGPQISAEMARRGLAWAFAAREPRHHPGLLGNPPSSFTAGDDLKGLTVVLSALAAGFVPVLSPLARGPLNVNADEAASALAVGIGAARIHFLTDVPGVFHDGWLVRSIRAGRAESLVGDGTFEGGIVPKLLAAAHAAHSGLVAEIGATAVVA